jgi:ketosteroid isomerase-like protein
MEHENAQLYRRITEAFQGGDIDTVKGVLAPDVRWHEAGNPQVIEGREAVLQRLSGTVQQLDGSVDLHDVLGSDEHVVAMINVALRKPDGSEVAYPAVEVLHVNEGLITERWAFMDACPPEVTAFFADLT